MEVPTALIGIEAGPQATVAEPPALRGSVKVGERIALAVPVSVSVSDSLKVKKLSNIPGWFGSAEKVAANPKERLLVDSNAYEVGNGGAGEP